MKRLIIGTIIFQISYIMVVGHALNPGYYAYRDIRISRSDPRLFVYDDTIFINRYLIDSLLRSIYEVHINRDDSALIPVGKMSLSHNRYDDVFIIDLANLFVTDGHLRIPYQSHSYVPGGYIKKGDIRKLYRSFSTIPNIEAKDIIDIINLYKKSDLSLRYLNCKMDFFKWSDILESNFEAVNCKIDKISRKYRYGVIDHTCCPAQYSIANDTTISVEERIEFITCMIEDIIKSHVREMPDIEQNTLVLELKQDIDSLQSLSTKRY